MILERKAMDTYRKDNLVAWCIVPFDACKRGPRERAEMLQRLGIRSLAYDWRDEHIATFDEELAQLQAHDIRLAAFYLLGGWPEDEDSAWDDRLNKAGFEFLQRNRLKTDVWLSYGGQGTEGVSGDEDRYDAAAQRVGVMAGVINSLGCRLGIYNHGGWGGEPNTMVEIARRLESRDVGIVYNFHHGHEHLDEMPGAFDAMLPHLVCVNLNGTTRGAEKVLPLGTGEEDLDILRMVRNSGYDGPIGILDHRDGIDAELSLRENIEGLQTLLAKLGDDSAMATYSGRSRP